MTALPLAGVRVLDFTWVIAGPWLTRMLATHGAEVLRLEHYTRPDVLRIYGPYRNGQQTEGYFNIINCDKLGFTLNLKSPKGVELVKRLVGISDVVAENFSARGLEKMGLGYEVLRGIKPDIIMISMPGMGMTGPHRDYVTYGPVLGPLAGVNHLSGFPDGNPTGTGISYPDYVTGLHGAFVVLSALLYRRRTGKGVYIDLSQFESAVSLFGITLLDYTANGRVQTRLSNALPRAAPHGCYRCLGEARWCTIAVFTEEEWKQLCRAIGNPAWTRDERFRTLRRRLVNRAELDRGVESWTSQRTAEEVMRVLQAAGIAAGVVQNNKDLLSDPHLEARQFWGEVEHHIVGNVRMEGLPFKLSETPTRIRTPGPYMGQHNDYVFGTLLRLPPQEVEKLAAEGVIA